MGHETINRRFRLLVAFAGMAVVALVAITVLRMRFGYLFSDGFPAKLEALARSAEGTEVRLSELAPFAWDRVVLLGPYNDQSMADKALGFHWSDFERSGLDTSDSFNMVVFADGEHVVRVEETKRCLPDFDPSLQGRSFVREEAAFRIGGRDYECKMLVLPSADQARARMSPPSLATITRDAAVDIANREVGKWGLNPKDLVVEVHDGPSFWKPYMEMVGRSLGADQQRTYQRWKTRLKDRSYWAIVYSTPAPPGVTIKDGGGTVLVDSNTGEVLVTSCALMMCQ